MKSTSTFGKWVVLPSAVGYAGKEFIIADETGNAGSYPISIDSTSPDTINGASSVSVSINYGAETVISDGTNWFAR
jgi:hypothetical protein